MTVEPLLLELLRTEQSVPAIGAEAWRRAIDGRGVQRGIHSQEYGGAASDGLAALDERGFHRARLATFAQHG